MKKIIDNRYELTTCTAIYVTAGVTTREQALYFHDREDKFHDGDSVIFDYNLDYFKNSDDFAEMDWQAMSRDWEDLETVRFESEDDAFQGDRLINWPAKN